VCVLEFLPAPFLAASFALFGNSPPTPTRRRRYIVHSTIGTPLSTNTFLATEEGECYGLAATPKRWMVPDLSPHTPVENLYLTGQDTLALGLSSSIQSGYLTANVLMGYGAPENVVLKRDIIVDLGLPPIFG